MLWFNDAIIEVLRQGVPLVSSISVAAWGTSRMTTPKVRHMAMYAGAGWLGGYVISTVAMKVLEGTTKALPIGTERTMPEPVTTGMAGLPYDPPIGNQVGEVVAIPNQNVPTFDPQSLSSRGENISVQGTMDEGSMGSAYGG